MFIKLKFTRALGRAELGNNDEKHPGSIYDISPSVLLLLQDSLRIEIQMLILTRSYWFVIGAERPLSWILPSGSAPNPFIS